jgi:RND family efflux transporter MFP subunit
MSHYKGNQMKKYIVLVVVLGFMGFGFYQKVYIPKHTFQTRSAQKANVSVRIHGVGNVGAKNIYKIGSIYGGQVFSFHIEEGDFVKKGDLIAKIDSVDLGNKIVELEASIHKLKKDINSLDIDKESAITQYEYQNDILKKNKKLFVQHAISELDFKKYKTNKEVAKLQVKSLASKMDSLSSQIAQIEASKKGLEEKLSRYTIYAPIDGYISKKLIANYAIINPNQTLIEIVNPSDVWVKTHIDTRISGEVKIGDLASIILRSSPKSYIGKVSNIKPINNSVTNEREIDVSFEKLPIPFYLEEQAIVDIKIKELKDVIEIPSKVLSMHKEQEGVWIVRNNIVHFQAIKILNYSDHTASTRDINTTDLLVLPNPKNKALKDGMKIYHD